MWSSEPDPVHTCTRCGAAMELGYFVGERGRDDYVVIYTCGSVEQYHRRNGELVLEHTRDPCGSGNAAT